MIYVFGNCELDIQHSELRCAGRSIKLERQVFRVLAYLVQHRHRVVPRQELFEQLWPQRFVSDWTLARCIALARQALGDSGRQQRVIETRHGAGYRFIATVTTRGAEATPDQAASVLTPQALPLPESITPPFTGNSALAAERKQVTALYCIIANALGLAGQLGPESMHHLVHEFFALALREVQRYEGHITQYLGYGFLALFGAFVAHEDHARRAVLAALRLHRGVRAGRMLVRPLSEGDLAVQIGVHTGVAVIARRGDAVSMPYAAVGSTTHLATQLAQHAEPGTLLVSDVTARQVHGEVRLKPFGTVYLATGTTPAFEVLGVEPQGASVRRFGQRDLSRFVGRKREGAVLRQVFRQVASGRGHVVGILGEAGAGKSRLLYEFLHRLPDTRVAYLEGRCRSYDSAVPYLPWRSIVRQHCDITDADNSETIHEKVRDGLATVVLDPDEGAPYLLQFLGVQAGTAPLAGRSPEAIKARTVGLVRQMLRNRSQRQPLLLILEDVHWSDRLSEELLASLVEGLAGAALCLLLTYRPGYQAPWMAQSSVTQLALSSLSSRDSLAVVRSVRQTARATDSLVQAILARAQGNPLFLEELTLASLDEAVPQTPMPVPDSIQAVLMARIDQLQEAPRRLLQTASVLGWECALRLLEAVWEGPEALSPLLQELQRREFLYEQPGGGESVYVFKHVLTQEVAYHSLLLPRRQTVHAAAGQALEQLYADRLEDVYDRLAYHYARTTEADKAVTYLMRFAAQATRAYAHEAAAAAFQDALRHVEQLPAAARHHRRLEVVLQLAQSFSFLGRFGESLELLLHHQELLERLQDSALTGPYYFRLGRTYSLLGDQAHAAQHTRRALAAAMRCNDVATMGKAYYELAREMVLSGPPQQGLEYCQRAVALLERAREQWWLGMAYWLLGGTYAFLGRFVQALDATARARAIGEALADPHIQSYAAFTTCWIEVSRGNGQTGLAACHESLAQAQDPVNRAHTLGVLGYAYLEQGEATQAMPLLAQAVESWAQFRVRPMQAWMTVLLGEAHRMHGQLAEARHLVQQGLTLARDVGFQFVIGLAQRALGHLAQVSGALTEAATHFTEALQTFTTMQARFEQARTQLDLAALAHAQGNLQAATTHLTEAHTLFQALQVPQYVERVAQCASAFGVALPAWRRRRM
jgi:DNA-binding winged helix-turn-helix (wHTH) protein/tetratricopeptide (TPR) repeat protein